ncbi:tetratricopeptide repeat protein [Akanthomyces lecanii RCEF 1005]|uniref:Tetratricopeptide repeat protein n=1 Tax=Akanthomyces lecanii RCEF 1005 TaxID=1081108 RepID=A0A162JB17_CORDF|nr:tetratricopeptide repeat protein [Akanthomyces lecanii RCEF 1005]
MPMLSAYELRDSKLHSSALRPKYQQLVTRSTGSINTPLESVIGLNLNHHDTCLFTKSFDSEGLSQLRQFVCETLAEAPKLVDMRLEDQEYQYATMSSYSPTMSELPLNRAGVFETNERLSTEATEWPSNRGTEGTSLSGFEMVQTPATRPDTSKAINLPCTLMNTHKSNDDFYGREDILQRLAGELLPSTKTTTASGAALRQFAICGFGGIGKTEIAREFYRRHACEFDAAFWIVADEVAKLDSQYQEISLALGLEDAVECSSQVVSRELVKGWLSNPRKQIGTSDDSQRLDAEKPNATWLLIFDNADDPIILADYWPQGSGSILITSRDPLAKKIFTRQESGINLKPLSSEEGLSLLNRLTAATDESEAETAKRISDALGGIPLAISQMAGIIRRQDLTINEFWELYTDSDEHAGLYETKFDTNLVTYQHSIATVWAFHKLKVQSRQLLELIAFFDPDNIDEELLKSASSELLSADVPFKKSNYLEARSDLLQSSLIQRDKQHQQISVHRVVQDAILTSISLETRFRIFEGILRVLWMRWPSALPKPSKEPELPQPKASGQRLNVGRWPVCSTIYPHTLRLHQIWTSLPSLPDIAKILFAKFLVEAAWYQKERGKTKGFDGFFDTALAICETSVHADRDAILADLYFCLGAIAMDASDFDASRIYKEKSFNLVFSICEDLGVEDERLYLAYAERGISRTQDQRYTEAEADMKEALRLRKSFGNYIPRAGEATLGWILLEQGKYEECEALLQQSLALREAALGKDDRESARTGLLLYVVGNLRSEQGKWEESFEYHQRTWKHMRETVGERDSYTARAAHKVAEHLFREGRMEEAIAVVNTALAAWSIDPSAHKNEIARTTFLKGKIFQAMNTSQKAAIAIRVACRLRKEITKDDRDAQSLSTTDFDRIVAFWSR